MKISTKLFAIATLLVGLSATFASCSKTPDTPVTPKIDIEEKTVSFAAAGEEKSVKFESNVDWTITVPADATWATVTPTSGKGGKATVAVKVLKNDGAERSAELTITAGTKSEKITIKQAGATEVPVGALLFPGADFEDLDVLKAALNTHGLKNAEIAEGGKKGKALKISTDAIEKNTYILTAKCPAGFSLAGKTSISFYVKGSAAKSLSIQVYKADGKYAALNVGDLTGDKTVKPTDKLNDKTGSGMNDYKGNINTNDKWVRVIFDISKISDITTTEGKDLFAIKMGNKAKYDILIDEVTIQ